MRGHVCICMRISHARGGHGDCFTLCNAVARRACVVSTLRWASLPHPLSLRLLLPARGAAGGSVEHHQLIICCDACHQCAGSSLKPQPPAGQGLGKAGRTCVRACVCASAEAAACAAMQRVRLSGDRSAVVGSPCQCIRAWPRMHRSTWAHMGGVTGACARACVHAWCLGSVTHHGTWEASRRMNPRRS